jgi:hypothetical protein
MKEEQKIPRAKQEFMKSIANKQIIESSPLYLDLSDSLLTRIDLFLSNCNLDKNGQKKLMKFFEETYSEGYTNSIID